MPQKRVKDRVLPPEARQREGRSTMPKTPSKSAAMPGLTAEQSRLAHS